MTNAPLQVPDRAKRDAPVASGWLNGCGAA
jgi:hypothetical protein